MVRKATWLRPTGITSNTSQAAMLRAVALTPPPPPPAADVVIYAADIAAAANAFPSQITYYFRTKEALFVEAACRDMLYVARAAEQAALRAQTPRDYTRALVETVTATDSVAFFAEALTLTRRRQDLAPLVERTIQRLHAEGMRAYAGQMERHGWRSLRDPDASSRRFWALAVGVIVKLVAGLDEW